MRLSLCRSRSGQVDLRGGLHSGGDLGDGCTAAIGCVLNVVPAHALPEHSGDAVIAIGVFGAALAKPFGRDNYDGRAENSLT